ncbi:hypothetical protein GCM10010486_87330 [Nonomuraea roseoviolacea subsp. carminata]
MCGASGPPPSAGYHRLIISSRYGLAAISGSGRDRSTSHMATVPTGYGPPGAGRLTAIGPPGAGRLTAIGPPGAGRLTAIGPPGADRLTGIGAPGADRLTGIGAPGAGRLAPIGPPVSAPAAAGDAASTRTARPATTPAAFEMADSRLLEATDAPVVLLPLDRPVRVAT